MKSFNSWVCVFIVLLALVIWATLSFSEKDGISINANKNISKVVPARTGSSANINISRETQKVSENSKRVNDALSAFDLNKLTSLVEGLDSGALENRKLISGQLYLWSLKDPEAALDYMNHYLLGDPQVYTTHLAAILAGWAVEKPFEVINYITTNPRNYPLSIESIHGPLMSAIKSDSDMFLESARQFPAEWIGATSRELATKYSDENGKIFILNYIDSLPPASEQKNAFLFGFADALAAGDWRKNPAGIESLTEIADSKEIAVKARKYFALTAAWSEPTAVIDWIESVIESPDEKKELHDTILRDWALRDGISYSNWVSNLPKERRTDDLILRIVEPVSSSDPMGALLWVKEVQNLNTRNELAQDIFDNIKDDGIKTQIEKMIKEGKLPGEMFK